MIEARYVRYIVMDTKSHEAHRQTAGPKYVRCIGSAHGRIDPHATRRHEPSERA